MSERVKNIVLGAAAVGAGAVLTGAILLNKTPASQELLGSSGGGSGQRVSVRVTWPGNEGIEVVGYPVSVKATVKEIHPSITLTAPEDDDVFLSPRFNSSVNYKDVASVSYRITAPGGTICELGPYHEDGTYDWATAAGATYSGEINLGQCGNGAYGAYSLKAYASGFSSDISDTITVNYARFKVGGVIYDAKGDPIVIINYGSGIGRIDLSARCGGGSEDILDGLKYIPEKNEDYIDEVLLPFKEKGVASGTTCTVEATAKKANGDPLNSQDTSGVTVSKTFNYTGVSL